MTFFVFITLLVTTLNQSQFHLSIPGIDTARWICLAVFPFALIYKLQTGTPLRRPALSDLFFILFLVGAGLSTFYSIEPRLTLLRTLSVVLLYVAVFWCVGTMVASEGPESLIRVLLFYTAAVFVISLLLVLQPERSFLAGRFRGIMQNPNGLALLHSLVAPLVFYKAFKTRSLLWILLLGAMIVSLLLSGSRTGILATGVGFAYLLLRAGFLKSAGILVLAGAVGYFVYGLDLKRPVQESAVNVEQRWSLEKLRTGSGRTEAWEAAADMIKKRPLLGHGFGTEELVYESRDWSFQEHSGAYIHNAYLGILFQMGVLGFVLLFLPLLGFILVSILKSGGQEFSLMHSVQAVILAGLVAAFFESWIYSVGNAFAFPFYCSLVVLLQCHVADKKEENELRIDPWAELAASRETAKKAPDGP
jgi:O-antigen ligase